MKGKRGKRSQAPQTGAASVAELNVTSSSSCALEILENRQNQEWAFDICRGWFLVEVEEEGEEKSFDGGAHRWVVFFFSSGPLAGPRIGSTPPQPIIRAVARSRCGACQWGGAAGHQQ